MLRVLAIDPGRHKCGAALMDGSLEVITRGVIATSSLVSVARIWARAHRPEVILVGSGTGGKRLAHDLKELGVPVQLVPECRTSLLARARYFEENPPRGWRRLVPLGLQTPPVPIDDYAAVIIAEQFLARVTSDG
jgi:RNase H-fold protein (predicted Holliday junction resolvase)